MQRWCRPLMGYNNKASFIQVGVLTYYLRPTYLQLLSIVRRATSILNSLLNTDARWIFTSKQGDGTAPDSQEEKGMKRKWGQRKKEAMAPSIIYFFRPRKLGAASRFSHRLNYGLRAKYAHTARPLLSICQKSRGMGCVIPRWHLQRVITQPILRLFWHVCSSELQPTISNFVRIKITLLHSPCQLQWHRLERQPS